MAIIENTPQRMILQSATTTLMLDKETGKVSMRRKTLMWEPEPIERPLCEIADVAVDPAANRYSGFEICHTMLISRNGEGWALPAFDKKDAEATAQRVREFLGIG